MNTLLKIGVPVLIGGGVAFGVWWFTRTDTPPPVEGGSASGMLRLRGYTQGRGYSSANVLQPLVSQGLQQIIFNRRRGAY